jgi:nucleoid-associated protein YejK
MQWIMQFHGVKRNRLFKIIAQPVLQADRIFIAAMFRFTGSAEKISIAFNIVLINKFVNNYWQ